MEGKLESSTNSNDSKTSIEGGSQILIKWASQKHGNGTTRGGRPDRGKQISSICPQSNYNHLQDREVLQTGDRRSFTSLFRKPTATRKTPLVTSPGLCMFL